jgi:hypothetical protein
MQFMYEAIKLDSDTNTMLYTNLNEELYDIPIISKNNVVLNSFDQLSLTLSGVGIEVFYKID